MNPMMWPGAPLTKALVITFSVYLCGFLWFGGIIVNFVIFVCYKMVEQGEICVKINHEMLCGPAVPLMGKFLCLASLSL